MKESEIKARIESASKRVHSSDYRPIGPELSVDIERALNALRAIEVAVLSRLDAPPDFAGTAPSAEIAALAKHEWEDDVRAVAGVLREAAAPLSEWVEQLTCDEDEPADVVELERTPLYRDPDPSKRD